MPNFFAENLSSKTHVDSTFTELLFWASRVGSRGVGTNWRKNEWVYRGLAGSIYASLKSGGRRYCDGEGALESHSWRTLSQYTHSTMRMSKVVFNFILESKPVFKWFLSFTAYYAVLIQYTSSVTKWRITRQSVFGNKGNYGIEHNKEASDRFTTFLFNPNLKRNTTVTLPMWTMFDLSSRRAHLAF